MVVAVPDAAFATLPSSVVGALSSVDAFAVAVILAGILCQRLHRRLPPGLGVSLFVFATTVGAAMAALHHRWPAEGSYYRACWITSISCVVWAFFGWLSSRRREAGAAGPAPSPAATFFAWSLVSGIAAAVLTVWVLVFVSCSRLLDPNAAAERLTGQGLWSIAALLVATCFWMATALRGQQPALLLVLAALMVWWTSLMIPSVVGDLGAPREALIPFQPVWWTWTFQMQFGLAALLSMASVLQERRHAARRRDAWPDRLDDLLLPYSRWPAYIQIEAVIASAILVLGVYQIVRGGLPSWQLSLAGGLASLAGGGVCLFMTYRRWSPNTAGLGMALLSLTAVSFACAAATGFGGARASTEYADRLPMLFNAALAALAVMIALWSWLCGFWRQQLLEGVPWTTAGRMIPTARRTQYLLTALAVLVACQMALWPRLVPTSHSDNTPGRLVAGIVVILLLAHVAAWNARRFNSIATACLSLAFLGACGAFIFIRLPASALRGGLIQYHAPVLSALAFPALVAAEALPKTKWMTFERPLWLLALLLLPAGALISLLSPGRLPADWVQPVTLAILGLLYGYAGSREHRRALLVLGAVFWVAALSGLYRSYSAVILSLCVG